MLAVARCAWMLRYFGATNVRILDGGLKKWVADGRSVIENVPMDATVYDKKDGDYSYSVDHPDRCILDVGVMHKYAGKLHRAGGGQSLDFQIVDARSKERFDGAVKEPRPGLRSGSINHSLNLPFNMLLNQDGTFK